MKNLKKLLTILLIPIILLFIFHVCYKNKTNMEIMKTNNTNALTANNYINNPNLNKIKIVAHRGVYSNEPENSMAAIKDSILHKVNYAEIDVQETKDGIVILMHDENLKRLTGVNKTVSELDYNQIEKLNIGMHYPFKYNFERIPTLNQVIRECNNKINLIIEIKPYYNTRDLTKKVVDIIDNNNFQKQCMIHSLSYSILLNVKRLNPNIPTGYIIYKPINNLTLLNVNFYSINEKSVTKKLILKIHNSNKKVYVWTVDNPIYVHKILRFNIDGIITDKPSLLISAKENKSE